MVGITGMCSRVIGDLVQALGVKRLSSPSPDRNPTSKPPDACPVDDLMLQALTAVFGMQDNGKIKKEKARKVVEELGLMYNEEDKSGFGGEDGEELLAGEVIIGLQEQSERRHELLREAFKIFDEDGDGFIEAVELKRVLECLGLDKGWDLGEIEKMLKVVDLDLDGKVDFNEFELMMV